MLGPKTALLRAPVVVGTPVKGPWLTPTGSPLIGGASSGDMLAWVGTLTCAGIPGSGGVLGCGGMLCAGALGCGGGGGGDGCEGG